MLMGLFHSSTAEPGRDIEISNW